MPVPPRLEVRYVSVLPDLHKLGYFRFAHSQHHEFETPPGFYDFGDHPPCQDIILTLVRKWHLSGEGDRGANPATPDPLGTHHLRDALVVHPSLGGCAVALFVRTPLPTSSTHNANVPRTTQVSGDLLQRRVQGGLVQVNGRLTKTSSSSSSWPWS